MLLLGPLLSAPRLSSALHFSGALRFGGALRARVLAPALFVLVLRQAVCAAEPALTLHTSCAASFAHKVTTARAVIRCVAS